jgi:anti-sigma factor RsiW
MNCQEAKPLLHPYVDGELDVVRHVEMESHIKDCPACAEREQSLRSLRVALSAPSLYYRAPAALRARLEAGAQPMPAETPPAEPRNRPMSRVVRAAVLSALAAAAASILFMAFRDRQLADDRLVAQVVASHIRSLQANHLMDKESTDQHTVKPWFQGKLDFSPQVPDFASKGFALAGGRLDYLADREVAALIYKCRAHIINVFVWPAAGDDTAVRAFSRQGYHLRHWRRGGINSWVISDVNDRDLDEFVRLFQEQSQEVGR